MQRTTDLESISDPTIREAIRVSIQETALRGRQHIVTVPCMDGAVLCSRRAILASRAEGRQSYSHPATDEYLYEGTSNWGFEWSVLLVVDKGRK